MRSDSFEKRRQRMVEEQIKARGIRNELVLQAMASVPREQFVAEHLRDLAYDDMPLPIGEDQTISQPYMVAMMIEALQLNGGERVLEIGGGCGYAAAVLAEIAAEVYSIERIEVLAERAKETLKQLGSDHVTVICADGTTGLSEHAPFDAIVVAAGGPKIPSQLVDQLKVGGRLVIPVGDEETSQRLVRVRRTTQTDYAEEILGLVRFVPLIGAEGWNEDDVVYHRDPGLTEDIERMLARASWRALRCCKSTPAILG